MSELVFEVTQDVEDGFVAEALGESIFTQAETWERLPSNVQEAVQAFYSDAAKPSAICLNFIRDKVLAVA